MKQRSRRVRYNHRWSIIALYPLCCNDILVFVLVIRSQMSIFSWAFKFISDIIWLPCGEWRSFLIFMDFVRALLMNGVLGCVIEIKRFHWFSLWVICAAGFRESFFNCGMIFEQCQRRAVSYHNGRVVRVLSFREY